MATPMKTPDRSTTDIETLEIELLLEAIRRHYGYDFTNYSPQSLHRRLQQMLRFKRLNHYSELIHHVLRDPKFFDELLKQLSINVTEMFRDPEFYRAVRAHVVPVLKTYPYIKVWHAGCATGEEVYSMAILLQEESFLDRAVLYATDFNAEALDTAKKGIYSIEQMAKYEINYRRAGGTRTLAGYYHAQYGYAKLDEGLQQAITFSYHNLVSDGVFGEMNVIFCRNVLIYFNRELQNRVLRLFTDSLRFGGFLCIGKGESLQFTACAGEYEVVDREQRIFRKIVPAPERIP
jgi:chemotaxis protein methyltransferase CheR